MLAPRHAYAATKVWTAGTDNWSTPADWNPSGAPAAGDAVNIVNSDGVARTITYDYTGPILPLGDLTIDLTGGADSDNLVINTARNLSTANEFVGVSGNGAVTQSAGTNTISTILNIGIVAGANGTYNLSGGSLNGVNSCIGGGTLFGGGNGSLNISNNGKATFSGALKVWNFANSALNLAGGSLSVGNLDLSGDLSRFHWTGGSFAVTRALDFTNTTDPIYNGIVFGNSLTLTSTQSLNAITWEYFYGAGSSLIQNGGSNFTPFILLGNTSGSGSPASYSLSGGTLTVPINEIVGYIGDYPGATGNGTFTQTGGTNSAGTLYVGDNPGATGGGAFYLNGGTLSVATEIVGFTNGTNIFSQTAGTHTITNNLQLSPGAAAFASYIISGGTVSAPNVYVAGSTTTAGGSVDFAITGGSMTVSGNLKVWNIPGTSVGLTSGSLSVGSIDLSGVFSHFIWTGGSLSITTANLTFSNTPDPVYNGLVFGNALTLNSSQSLSVSHAEYLYGAATTITQNGGSNTAADLYMGNVSGSGGPDTYTLNSGSLSFSAFEAIGYVGIYSGTTGNAVFNQFGGSNTTLVFQVGFSPGNLGFATYNLAGGTLTVQADETVGYINGTAGFNQSAGAHTIVESLFIARNPGTTAMFTLSGGALSANSLFLGGDTSNIGGTGTLNISGGVMTVDSATVYSTGAFSLSDGSLTISNSLLLLHSSFKQTGGFSYLGAVSDNGTNGALNILGGNATALSVNLNVVSLANSGQLSIAPSAAASASTLNVLAFAGTTNRWHGTLDITNNPLVVEANANKPAVLAGLQNQALNHNLTSASVTADPSHLTLVIADNALLGLTLFNGAAVDSNSLLIEATWFGDSNLDRQVDVTDLGTLATNYGKTVPNGPLQGDFNNDGHVDVTDLGLLATNYGAGTNGQPFSLGASASSVPEPASIGLLGLAALHVLTRRRRRSDSPGSSVFIPFGKKLGYPLGCVQF
jgi:hypothetical protein